MHIELFASNTLHPPLYDAYIDREGTIFPMAPEPREYLEDLMQVVFEGDDLGMTFDQREAVRFLIKMNGDAEAHWFQPVFLGEPLDMLLNIHTIY